MKKGMSRTAGRHTPRRQAGKVSDQTGHDPSFGFMPQVHNKLVSDTTRSLRLTVETGNVYSVPAPLWLSCRPAQRLQPPLPLESERNKTYYGVPPASRPLLQTPRHAHHPSHRPCHPSPLAFLFSHQTLLPHIQEYLHSHLPILYPFALPGPTPNPHLDHGWSDTHTLAGVSFTTDDISTMQRTRGPGSSAWCKDKNPAGSCYRVCLCPLFQVPSQKRYAVPLDASLHFLFMLWHPVVPPGDTEGPGQT
ncbi:uncharacterized protein UV8b_00378 [Ustilaginoidea virens]|uniref:Uncharacterized protein n=1 Tax=Ustilaginoidea virens TaxID=1159556 RepID=A0A8E5HIZ4_USTVR|nr:uncharacterized protein UV8b_00378 [Ustilaginoidea virens]QUC16137.1 hypothetical protein UV8b_00378 [Ustilaginoidea virens]